MAENKVDQEKLKVMTTEFRVSHPHVFKPSSMPGETKQSYSIEMLFDKKITDVSHLQNPIKEAIIGKWGKDKSKWPTPLKMPIRDGDKPYGKKKEIKKEHVGMWVVRASSSAEYAAPHVVGRDSNVELEDEKDFYPGCYARAHLKAFAYTFADKDGVKFVLDGVQFIRDGQAFGGKKPANQMFGIIEGDSGDSGDSDLMNEPSEESDSFM